MKPTLSFALTAALLATTWCALPAAHAARDEVWDVEEEVLAQMARMKVRKHTENKARSVLTQQDKDSSTPGSCGNLNIGNVKNTRANGDQKITIVVTGDVINANNKCPR
jgi:hypothetical protein